VAVSVDVEMSAWSRRWLSVEGLDGDDATVIRVRGGIAADRAEELWEAIEGALERAVGARVVVDLSGVTGFDIGSIEELTEAAMAAVRRHADLCALVKPYSPLDHYLRCCGLAHQLPLYDSLIAALDSESDLADLLVVRVDRRCGRHRSGVESACNCKHTG
jgi:anti-anti-sigma factor